MYTVHVFSMGWYLKKELEYVILRDCMPDESHSGAKETFSHDIGLRRRRAKTYNDVAQR